MFLYAFACMLGSFLLFGLEPLAGKYVLPLFGGGPTVWTGCMVFFQVALLGGYGYGRVLQGRFNLKRQTVIHLSLLLAVGLWLLGRAWAVGAPLAPGVGAATGSVSTFMLRIVGLLGVMVGPPFVLVSATAPVLQDWFARAWPDRPPYRLYAFSNVGSIVALLSYPTLVEPYLSRSAQAWAWTALFGVFGVLCAFCARAARARGEVASQASRTDTETTEQEPSPARFTCWVFISAVSTTLLLAATNQLSQEVAAGPLLWVVPLVIYLATFILCFGREQLYHRGLALFVIAAALYWTSAWQVSNHELRIEQQLLAYGGLLFATCWICHGELYRLRPAPKYSSRFYTALALGGALGGVFVGLVAPYLFDTYFELPLGIAAAVGVGAFGSFTEARARALNRSRQLTRVAGYFVLALVVGVFASVMHKDSRSIVWRGRNFFGVMRIEEMEPGTPRHSLVLRHGPIEHGKQYLDPDKRLLPSAYFGYDSGLGRAVSLQRERLRAVGGERLKVGVLGLGIGTAAALLEPSESLRFYEIDPLVIEVAQGRGGYFSYWKDARAQLSLVPGDARRALEQELAEGGSQNFDLLVVDTFAGDAVPSHLLTREAMQTYARHLAPGGLLVVQVTNRHLDLAPVVTAHAAALGMEAFRVDNVAEGITHESSWMVLGPKGALTREKLLTAKNQVTRREPTRLVWTDEHNALFPLLVRHGRF